MGSRTVLQPPGSAGLAPVSMVVKIVDHTTVGRSIPVSPEDTPAAQPSKAALVTRPLHYPVTRKVALRALLPAGSIRSGDDWLRLCSEDQFPQAFKAAVGEGHGLPVEPASGSMSVARSHNAPRARRRFQRPA